MDNEQKIYIKDEQALLSLMKDKINHPNTEEITIICAGHFLILPDKEKQKLIPGIFEGEQEEYYALAQSGIGLFPQYTWKLGCAVLKQIKSKGGNGKLSLLINDWQLVPNDEYREKSKPNSFRENFYTTFTKLPAIYSRELDAHVLKFTEDIFINEDNEFFLREVRLRDRFARKMKSLIKHDSSTKVGMCSLNLDECGNISMSQENSPAYALTIDSKAGCAGGVSQMMVDIVNQLRSKYIRINFINLMPSGCTVPVNVASELSLNIIEEDLSDTAISITNIFLDSHGISTEEGFYESYGRKVFCYEFKSKNYV